MANESKSLEVQKEEMVPTVGQAGRVQLRLGVDQEQQVDLRRVQLLAVDLVKLPLLEIQDLVDEGLELRDQRPILVARHEQSLASKPWSRQRVNGDGVDWTGDGVGFCLFARCELEPAIEKTRKGKSQLRPRSDAAAIRA